MEKINEIKEQRQQLSDAKANHDRKIKSRKKRIREIKEVVDVYYDGEGEQLGSAVTAFINYNISMCGLSNTPLKQN